MIELTVKTLDSQNHAFTVQDDMTVGQFKEHIVGVINIPVESQRLIYCGRVLQDEKKLQDYNVNGKVIHLVQKAPPSATRRSRSPQPSPSNARRVLRFDAPGNAMFLGSMAFPGSIIDPPGIVPPGQIQSLSGSRLNVARRMIHRAESVLNRLENPDNQPRESPSNEELQDEVTPVFAAQVIIPHGQGEGAAAANNQSEQAAASSANAEQPASEAQSSQNAEQRLPENATGTVEMSRLLDELNKVNQRLRPFLERYHTFMRDDAAVSAEDAPRTQSMVTQVSEVMHLLGHAYHSLSDVIVQVSTPPPRPLLCRPILIQHSAVLQAGIPIQVEVRQAQMNFDPNNTATTPPNQTQPNSTDQSPQNTETPNRAQPEDGAQPPPQQNIPTARVRPNVHEIRIDSFPFNLPRAPMFTVQHRVPTATVQPTVQSNQGQNQGSESAPTANEPGAPQLQQPNVVVMPPFNNINVNPMEIFMEVTPEGITIDSLETTVVSSTAQTENVLYGAFHSSLEFINSILQAVTGQMMGGDLSATPSQTSVASTSTSTTTLDSQSESTQTTTPTSANSSASNVNSQARGNTQTHPTTATQTRSTSRPHVHLAQHSMQGFDPYLPCNSHHIRRRRSHATANANTNASANASTGNEGGEQQNNNQAPNALYNVVEGLFRSLSNLTRQQEQRERPAQQETAPSSNTAQPQRTQAASQTQQDPAATFENFAQAGAGMSFIDLAAVVDEARNSQTTLASFLQNFPGHSHTEGESVFTDLFMLLARGLTFGDIISLYTGHIDSLVRVRPMLRTFFMDRILNGEVQSQASLDRAVNNLIEELQPVLESFSSMRARDDIDIVESATQLCRTRFPNIISLVISRMMGSLRSLVDQFLLTVQHLFALLLHSNLDGQNGVEDVFRTLVARYTEGISPDFQQWTVNTSITYLQRFLNNLEMPASEVQQYIVTRSGTRNATNSTITAPPEPEQMEVDEPNSVEMAAITEEVPLLDAEHLIDIEPLPNVVIGSESWHRSLSAEWIPIITRDSQRQRRQNSQPPFSDAYLSGMPSKRRKIVANSKPQGTVPQIISDGVRQAVTATGLVNAAPLDAVIQAAGSDPTLNSAYRELLRNSVQAGLRDNPDFTPERFPNASNYFNAKKN